VKRGVLAEAYPALFTSLNEKGNQMSQDEPIKRYGHRVGYNAAELKKFCEGGHRVRQIKRLSQAAPLYSIEAEVVSAKHCNSGYREGDKFVLDVDGNLISKHCPKRLCVYLISQLTIPVALINERLSEDLDPNDFHFMRYARCPDVGVECFGYGEVMVRISVVSREKYA
jgi:uncharacterized repeat protein (TIGR04076 family)